MQVAPLAWVGSAESLPGASSLDPSGAAHITLLAMVAVTDSSYMRHGSCGRRLAVSEGVCVCMGAPATPTGLCVPPAWVGPARWSPLAPPTSAPHRVRPSSPCLPAPSLWPVLLRALCLRRRGGVRTGDSADECGMVRGGVAGARGTGAWGATGRGSWWGSVRVRAGSRCGVARDWH